MEFDDQTAAGLGPDRFPVSSVPSRQIGGTRSAGNGGRITHFTKDAGGQVDVGAIDQDVDIGTHLDERVTVSERREAQTFHEEKRDGLLAKALDEPDACAGGAQVVLGDRRSIGGDFTCDRRWRRHLRLEKCLCDKPLHAMTATEPQELGPIHLRGEAMNFPCRPLGNAASAACDQQLELRRVHRRGVLVDLEAVATAI